MSHSFWSMRMSIVKDALKKCAEALHHGNRELANSRMKIVLDLAEEETDSKTRRLIRYFAEALARRAYGLHPKYLSFPLSDWKRGICYQHDIFGAVGRTISNVIKGKSKVHVIELAHHGDIFFQWQNILGDIYRWGDLKHLRLSLLVQGNVQFSKEREEALIRAAKKSSHLEFEYKIIDVNSLADMDLSMLEMRPGEEFVVVNCMFVLSKMLWEAVALEKVLLTVRDVIKPDIMIVADRDHDANHNQSDFLLRFDESLEYYSSLFEERRIHFTEVELYHKYQICNIVACEGSNRVERHQTRAQWKSLLNDYGFSIHYLPSESEYKYFAWTLENGMLVIGSGNAETEKRPLFFVSAWTITRRPFKSSGSNNEGHSIISSEAHELQTFQIVHEDLYLIRMASLAEIYDILLNISEHCNEKLYFLMWANCARPAYLHDESNPPLKPVLRIVDSASFFLLEWLLPQNILKLQLEEGKGFVGKALADNGPFYVPDVSKLEENVCPYIDPFFKESFLFGALAIKFSNLYTNGSNYVVELLFPRSNMTLERQEQLVHRIIDDLKNARPRFVTYVSDTMLVTCNPPSQSTSNFDLNGANQRVGNAMDVQGPMQQGPDANATSHTKASIENPMAPPIGDFNLNGRLSLSGINQTTGFLAADMQRPHKQYLLWDFTHEDLELLRKWKNPKMTGQHVGLDEKFKVQDKFLAPLVISLVDAIIQVKPQVYYIADEVVDTYFCLLTKRSKENPEVFLKHDSLDSSKGTLLLGGDQPSVPSWINPEEQINTCKLFLPLCFSDHWTLFCADIKDQKFLGLDPRKGSEMPMTSNFKRIREWFKSSVLPAMGLHNAGDWPLIVPGDIPKQQNGIDCAIFVMKYADCLTHANYIGFPFSQEDMPYFRERIFLDIYNGKIHVPENFVRS